MAYLDWFTVIVVQRPRTFNGYWCRLRGCFWRYLLDERRVFQSLVAFGFTSLASAELIARFLLCCGGGTRRSRRCGRCGR